MKSAYDEDTHNLMEVEIAEDVCLSLTLANNNIHLVINQFILTKDM
jgi:hypothetical protein